MQPLSSLLQGEMAQNFHPGQERERWSASCASCRSSCSGQRSRLRAVLFLSKIETFSLSLCLQITGLVLRHSFTSAAIPLQPSNWQFPLKECLLQSLILSIYHISLQQFEVFSRITCTVVIEVSQELPILFVANRPMKYTSAKYMERKEFDL